MEQPITKASEAERQGGKAQERPRPSIARDQTASKLRSRAAECLKGQASVRPSAAEAEDWSGERRRSRELRKLTA